MSKSSLCIKVFGLRKVSAAKSALYKCNSVHISLSKRQFYLYNIMTDDLCCLNILQVIKNDLNPKWRPFDVKMSHLCGGNQGATVQVCVKKFFYFLKN